MATLDGELWRFNFVNVVLVDVSDDYRYLLDPLPSECYPVITQKLVPTVLVNQSLPAAVAEEGFLYDWHETSPDHCEPWYVGMVRANVEIKVP
jgi:hypothetical protein